nr:putative ribonuclease H-like domain-containing protein [Tanacetum cinerariifolium]
MKDGKSASTPIDIEKPLLKEPDGEDVDVHIYSDYARASLDRKSTTRGCQFLGYQLISWQCKKQTFVATSSTEADYVAVTSCCAQVLWIQNHLLDYGHFITVVSYKLMLFGLTKDSAVKLMLLDDADGVECFSNEEMFAELACMGYEKPPPKLTFYKAFFSTQWKFLIHNLVQCVSAKGTAVGKGFSKVKTPLFASMLVQPQPQDVEEEDDVEVPAAPTPPSFTIAPSPPPQDPIPIPPQAQPVTLLSPP